MNFIVSLVRLVFKIPLISQILSGLILFGLSFFCLRYAVNFIQPKTLFISSKSFIFIVFYLSIVFSFFPFWSIGQKLGAYLLKSFIKSMFLFIPFSFILEKMKVNFSSSSFLYFSLFLGMALPLVYKILTSRKRTVLNKTMSEIDNFGKESNGKKNTKIAGDLFEEYIRDCFKSLGYEAYTTTEMKEKGISPKGLEKLSGDGGADVIATSGEERLVIQCKHYSNTVGVEACYQAHGALKVYNGTQAVVITNHFFTEEAKFNANQNDIILIDRIKLTQFIADVSKESEKNKTEPMLFQRFFKSKNSKKVA